MNNTKKLLPCPKCGREIDIEEDTWGGTENWKPTFYDPDSGGEPYEIRCKCGIRFCSGNYDWKEFVKSWNERV